MIFLSTYINAIDSKGRVVVPKEFRAILNNFQGFIGFRSYKTSAIDCYTMEKMESYSNKIDETLDPFSQERDQIQTSVFADAILLRFDKDGRTILPKVLLEHSEIESEVAFVGLGASFQIWNPRLFEKHQIDNRAKLRGI